MGSDKIFMFDNPAAGESAGIMSMIPALLQNKGLDPNLVAALMNGNKNQDAWGGAGCYWIWIILLFFLWGGNGFGNGFGNGVNGIPAQLNNEAGRELLMNAIQGNGTAINQLASSLSCSTQQLQNAICQIQGQIQQVGNQVGLSSQQIINSIQSNSAAIGSQLASCCCDIRTAIERQGCDSRLATVEQTNTLTSNANTQFNIISPKTYLLSCSNSFISYLIYANSIIAFFKLTNKGIADMPPLQSNCLKEGTTSPLSSIS